MRPSEKPQDAPQATPGAESHPIHSSMLKQPFEPLVTIELPFATPSLNILLRWHWAKRHKLMEQCTWYFIAAIRSVPVWDAKRCHTVTVTRHGRRTIDPDNFVGGCKPLIDALKQAGFLYDDSETWAAVRYWQSGKRSKVEKTVVEIW